MLFKEIKLNKQNDLKNENFYLKRCQILNLHQRSYKYLIAYFNQMIHGTKKQKIVKTEQELKEEQ